MAQRAIRTTLPDGRIALNNIIDKYTGESIQLVKVDSLPTGVSADGIIYFQTNDSTLGVEYWKRSYAGPIQSSWLQLDNTGIGDVSPIINKYIQIDDIKLSSGTYLGLFDIQSNKLIGGKNVVLKSPPDADVDSIVVNVRLGGSLEDISVDGDGVAGTGINIAGSSISESTINNISISNLYGESVSSKGIRVISPSEGHKLVTIKNSYFQNIDALPSGSVGSDAGSARGIRIDGQNANVSIENCVFDNVGSWEDGDCVYIQSSPDEDDVWTRVKVTISNCEFRNIKKRAVKCQASGVTVSNCRITSPFIDEDECAQEAILLQGSFNIAENNSIELERAFYGIKSEGRFNTIKGNYIILDPNSLYPSARGNNITAAIGDEGINTNIINNIKLSANTYGVNIQNASGSLVENNDIEGKVELRINTTNCLVKGNTIRRRSGISGFTYGVVLLGSATNTDNTVKNNIFINHTYGVSLGSNSINTIGTRWVVVGNEGQGLQNGMYIYYTGNLSACIIGGALNDFGHSSDIVYSASSNKDADTLTPEEVAILSSSLPNVPSTSLVGSGSVWWRITTQRVSRGGTDLGQYEQTAIATDGSLATNNSSVTCKRYYNGTTWTDWVKVLTSRDKYGAIEITSGSLSMTGTTYRYISINSNTTISVSNNNVGSFVVVRVSNSNASPVTISFTGVTMQSDFVVPGAAGGENGQLQLILISTTSTRVYILPSQVEGSPDTATVTDTDALAVLTELRDLKTKMRAAGLLSE